MKESIFKLIHQYIRQLLIATSGIGFYDDVIADMEEQRSKVEPIHADLKSQIDDQKNFGSLSVQEQQALGQNELNYKHLIRQINDSIQHLMTQKWSNNIRTALWMLEDIQITVEAVLGDIYDLEEIGETIIAKELIPEKRFNEADYLTKIHMVQIAIKVLIDDLIEDVEMPKDLRFTKANYVKTFFIVTLQKTAVILQRELEDMEANGLPKPHKFELPELIKPEIPESPIDEEKEENREAAAEAGEKEADNRVPAEADNESSN